MLMLTLGIMLLGVVSLQRMPMALLPDMRFPAAAVVIEYPNVGPWEVESQVTRHIEEVLGTVSNVTNISSTSAAGSATIVAQFEWGTNMDFATLEMRERLDLIREYLPDGVSEPQVFKFDPSLNPMFQLNVGGSMDPAALRAFVDDNIRNRLERIEGVASVEIQGGLIREIQVNVDPQRLDLYGVTFERVEQALMAGNLNLPGGSLEDRGQRLLIRTVGEFTSLDEIRETVVQVGPSGTVRIADIATVDDVYVEGDTLTRLNGEPSIAINIQKESEANTVTVSNAIFKEIERLEAEYGDLITFQVVWDEARLVRVAIQSVIESGVIGAVSAIIVLYVFLGSLRPTFVISVAIPVAAVGTLFFLYLLDTSLNMLSLGGLALGLGMLVDNAIVSLENITRHQDEGKEFLEAAAVGAEEVGLALFASTLTTIAVFLPVVFVGGLAAEIFRDLSLAVTFSLGLSLLVAVTFVPTVAGRIDLRSRKSRKAARELAATSEVVDADAASPATPHKPKRDMNKRMQAWYENILRWVLDHKGWFLGGIGALLIATAAAYPFIGMEFFPEMDTGELNIRVRLPYGSPREMTLSTVEEVEQFLASIPEINAYSTAITDETAQMIVTLVAAKERQRTTQQVIEEIRAFAAGFHGAQIRVTPSDPFGVGSGMGAPINIALRGTNIDELEAAANQVAEIVRNVPGTREVETSFSAGRPELQIVVDRPQAARFGLTVGQIGSAVRRAFDGVVATRFRVGDGNEVDIVVQLGEAWRANPSDLEALRIPTPFGTTVPLGDLASIEWSESPVSIERDDGARVIRVFAYLVGRDLSSVARDIERGIQALDLPGDITYQFDGDEAEMRDAFNRLTFAFGLAIILMYMILAAQFESFSQPFIIMFSVPVALVGVVASLLLTGRALGVTAMIGVIMLAGIAINNAIVLIDYINQLRQAGMERREAVVVGARTRLRPVLMTTATTVMGMLPMAFGIGEGSELQAPIATVVIGGLTMSTVLTLGLIPTLYEIVDDATQKFSRWAHLFRRKESKSYGG